MSFVDTFRRLDYSNRLIIEYVIVFIIFGIYLYVKIIFEKK
jgi:hypothetical protein